MKILHVETGKNIYGGALQVLYLIKGLRERGIYSILVCTAGSKIFSEAKAFTDKIYAIPMRGDVDILFIWRLMRIIKKVLTKRVSPWKRLNVFIVLLILKDIPSHAIRGGLLKNLTYHHLQNLSGLLPN